MTSRAMRISETDSVEPISLPSRYVDVVNSFNGNPELLHSELIKENTKLYSLLQIGNIINSNLTNEQLLALVLLYARDLLDSDASSLFLLDPSRTFLYCEVSLGNHSADLIQKYLKLKIGRGIAGWVAQERKPATINDVQNDPRFDPSWDARTGYETKSMVCVPLLYQNDLLGTLQVLNKRKGELYNKRDELFLSAMGDLTVIAIRNARLYDKLNKRVLEISLLHDLEKLIIAGDGILTIMEWLMEKTLEVLEAKSGSILLWDESKQCLRFSTARGLPQDVVENTCISLGEGISGKVALERKPLLILNIEEEGFQSSNKKHYETKSSISVPLLHKDHLIGVFNVNNKKSGYAFTAEDLDILNTIGQKLALAITNIRFYDKMKETSEELEQARVLMSKIIPDELPDIRGLDIHAHYISHRGIGGDFYKFIPISDDKLGILIADVSGHGLSAALLAISASSIISTLDIDVTANVDQFLSNFNYLLSNRMAGNFITIFYGIIDVKKRSILYANAGHNNPILVRGKGFRAEYLKARGKPVGLFSKLIFEQGQTRFEPGDRLVIYTDGLIEATNRNGFMYGEERLVKISSDSKIKTSAQLSDMIVQDVSEFAGKEDFEDDVTLISVMAKEEGFPGQ